MGQGVEAREQIFAACFILFYVIPEVLRMFLVCAALQEGATRVEGFLVLIHMQDSESLTGFFLWIGLDVHC